MEGYLGQESKKISMQGASTVVGLADIAEDILLAKERRFTVESLDKGRGQVKPDAETSLRECLICVPEGRGASKLHSMQTTDANVLAMQIHMTRFWR